MYTSKINLRLKKLLKQINNIEVAFTDIFGNLREIVISTSKLKDALNFGLKCDGSSIGEYNVCESDMKIFLDQAAIYILPNKNLLIFANTDFDFDPRKKLIEIENNYLAKNIKINIGAELEFFMFKDSSKTDKLGYYQLSEECEFDCLNDIMQYLQSVNFPIETFHHECGNGQFEINFKYNISHKTADNIVFLKKIISYFAKKYNFRVSFEPKPFENNCGSGMHTNISVSQKKRNLFYDRNDKLNLSKMAYEFAKGIINHIEAITAISNPTENSFERLISGEEVPKQIDICSSNRNSLIRVPVSNERATRLEFRLPDGSSNPYLLFSSIILAGFDASQKQNINKKLPANIEDAKSCLKTDKLFKKIIPNIYFDK